MIQKERVFTIPRIGIYTEIFKDFFEELGLKVILPPKPTEETIKFGCRNSSDMMCYPYKVTLGNLKDAIDMGANTILMYDTVGQCRFRHYHKLYDLALKQHGYDIDIITARANIIFKLKKCSNRSYLKILRTIYKYYKIIVAKEKQVIIPDKVNIGLIGEIYTCLDDDVNYHIIDKFKKKDVNTYNTSVLKEFFKITIENKIHLNIWDRKYKKKARRYIEDKIGGHGFENICNTYKLIDKNIDGIVHLLPLSCMPESTVEPIINKICKENKIPLLRIPIDETNSEANVNTRLEAFVELIKRKRGLQ